MISRLIESHLLDRVDRGKAIVVLGPRQVGKTTLVRSLTQQLDRSFLYLNGDEPDVPGMLSAKTSSELAALIGKHKLVVIDEAQRIKDIGLTLKLIIDNLPGVQLLVLTPQSNYLI